MDTIPNSDTDDYSQKKAAEKLMHLFLTPQRRSVRLPGPIFESAEKIDFVFDGVIVRGFRWRAAGARKALILHGHESSIQNFEPYIQGLVAKGYEVLAVDAPAHGMSEGTTLNAVSYRDFILAINKNYGTVTSFIGHSFGGLVIPLALEKISCDERFRIALIAPATETTSTIERYFGLLKINDKKVRSHFDQLITEIGGHPASWYSVSRSLPALPVHTLWIHDEDDPVTPIKDALAVKVKNYPLIKFVITKGLGHKQIYKDPAVIEAVVHFV